MLRSVPSSSGEECSLWTREKQQFIFSSTATYQHKYRRVPADMYKASIRLIPKTLKSEFRLCRLEFGGREGIEVAQAEA